MIEALAQFLFGAIRELEYRPPLIFVHFGARWSTDPAAIEASSYVHPETGRTHLSLCSGKLELVWLLG